MLKEMKDYMISLSIQIENINKEIEITKRTKQILKLKCTITEIKNPLQ